MKSNRLIFTIFAFFLIFDWNIGQAQDWSGEISVTPTGTNTPDFDIDPYTGHLHIVTMMSERGVIYTEMDKNGTFIQQSPISVAETDGSAGGMRFGATIAVDPQGRPHVCYRQFNGGVRFSVFHTFLDGSNWTLPLRVSRAIKRGWMVRIDVDDNEKTHVVHGSMLEDPNDPEGNLLAGPAYYYKSFDGVVHPVREDITRYCADERLEIDTYGQDQIHIILGTSDYPPWGGSIWYWRSLDGGSSWYQNDIHNINARQRNGSPDLFIDASGNVHIVYGSGQDWDLNKTASVRYVRFEQNHKLFDIPITEAGEISVREFAPQGMGSVAASGDGQIVIIAYSEDLGSNLWVRESHDAGQTWSDRTLITDGSCAAEGRNKHLIRAYYDGEKIDRFYIVYPSANGVKLRYKEIVKNLPPTADAGGPYEGNEGSNITFDASASSDLEGNIIQYEWDFQNDGIWDQTTTSPTTTYKYPDDFNGQIKVQVTDSNSLTDTDVANVTIHNVPPTANAGGPYSGDIGEIIYFQGSGNDPGTDDLATLTFEWDLNNDGIFEVNGQNAQKSFINGGIHNIVLKVSDDDGGSDTETATVSIQNDPPVIGDIPDQTINEGESFDPINLYDAVTDPDNSDNEISWNFENLEHLDITIQNKKFANVAPVDPEWNGSETITFVATDPGQASDAAEVTFTINGVNDPPQVSDIIISPIDEGESFDPIVLDPYVYDPDDEPGDILWTVSGQNKLNIDIDLQQRVAQINTPNDDWYGSETVTFVATDKNGSGLSDNCTTIITVNPVNDPPVIIPGFGQKINHTREFTQVNLNNYVTDVDNPDSEIQWSYFGNNDLIVDILNRKLTITKPYPDWIGSEDITFIASDGELSDSVTAIFTVIYHNDPPVISDIEGETVNENGQFNTIYLDNRVHDPDHDDEELVWSIIGAVQLSFDGLAQRVLTISVVDSEWAGSENITFVVTDPGGLKDSTNAIYTVIPDNDPPELTQLPDITFNEDTSFTITASELQLLVFDPDNSFDQLQFSIANNIFTHASINQQSGDMIFSADPDWYGVEEVLFNVIDDQFGATSQPIQITVNSKPDPPMSFDLLKPDYGVSYSVAPPSINFFWEKAIDPDKDDVVTYTWNLSRDVNFEHIIDQYNSLTDTFKTYYLPSDIHEGVYYWQVIALDGIGNSTVCNNIGGFYIEQGIGINPDNNSKIPEEFALLPNYPNPFNPETKITYHLSSLCHVRLQVYNSLGRMIRTLVDQKQNAGIFSTYWNGRNTNNELVSSGIYIFKIEAGNFRMARKMLLLQ